MPKFYDCGHGWVWPLTDASKTNCGGATVCRQCRIDLDVMRTMYQEAMLRAAMQKPPIEIVNADQLQKLMLRVRHLAPYWVVFRPANLDYPGRWIVRMNVCRPTEKHTRFLIRGDKLSAVQMILHACKFLQRTPRKREDDPEIEETWA